MTWLAVKGKCIHCILNLLARNLYKCSVGCTQEKVDLSSWIFVLVSEQQKVQQNISCKVVSCNTCASVEFNVGCVFFLLLLLLCGLHRHHQNQNWVLLYQSSRIMNTHIIHEFLRRRELFFCWLDCSAAASATTTVVLFVA